MQLSEIDAVINNATLSNTMTGGCVSFTVALDIVFGIDTVMCVFDPWDDSKPLHAIGVIDGVAVDGGGIHESSEPDEYVKDWWSGLQATDFSAVRKRQDEMDCSQAEAFTWFLNDQGFDTFENVDILYHIGASEVEVENYVSALTESKESLGL